MENSFSQVYGLGMRVGTTSADCYGFVNDIIRSVEFCVRSFSGGDLIEGCVRLIVMIIFLVVSGDDRSSVDEQSQLDRFLRP